PHTIHQLFLRFRLWWGVNIVVHHGLTRVAEARKQATGEAFWSLVRMLPIAPFEIRLLKTGFQPKRKSPWKDLGVGISFQCEREGKLIAILGRQKIPARSKALFNPRPPLNEFFKDRFLPFDRNKVRHCRSLGEFLKKLLSSPRIMMTTT